MHPGNALDGKRASIGQISNIFVLFEESKCIASCLILKYSKHTFYNSHLVQCCRQSLFE
jgi:hypothetical protein